MRFQPVTFRQNMFANKMYGFNIFHVSNFVYDDKVILLTICDMKGSGRQ